ncbi:MAG TPA: LysM peptidoglycan-binding domain-containing protein [Chitinophagaceae bacterium]|nr:LysM peptidoglycan-binding domain-containing protein [Chitinophagaceae bacterium]
MKNLVTAAILLMLTGPCLGQPGDLLLQTGSQGAYLVHTVTPKENFYSIGRLFNVHPRHLAAYNHLNMAKGLTIGQPLRIPLTDTNFSYEAKQGAPVYFKTPATEDLARISSQCRVPVSAIRKYNHLASDKIAAGSRLVVGRLVVQEDQSLTGVPANTQQESRRDNPPASEPKQEPQVTNRPSSEQTGERKQAETTLPQVPSTSQQQAAQKPPVRQQPDEPSTQEKLSTGQPGKEANLPATASNTAEGTGFFKSAFAQQIRTSPLSREETVTAGIFKTTSGWNDAKYYVLLDHVQPGTIIRISNPTNNRIVYAKVLGELSGIRQNQGYGLRISNAAAATLGITEDDKFIVQISY